MKQKQVKAAANGAKATKKQTPPKKVQEVVEENEEEEEEVVSPKKAAVAKKSVNNKAAKNQKPVVKEVVSPKKPANKKATKVQKVVEEEPVEKEEENDDEEVLQEEDEEEQEEEAMEDEEDEQEEDENEDEEMEAEEEAEEDDDEEQTEQPTIPSKVKSGEIPSTVQSSKIIHITKLPKKCKQIDIVEAFAKFGAIDQIHMVTTPGGTVANVAYKTVKAAKAALAANKSIKVQDSLVSVSLRKAKTTEKKQKDRSCEIYIRNIKIGTTEEQLKEHFKSCGEIETVKILDKRVVSFGYITFKDKSSVDAALKLHNSILNDANITVVRNDKDFMKWTDRYDQKRTIKLMNKQQFATIDSKKIESIFSKIGAIERLDVLCCNNILALVTFETEEAAQKALELNEKTLEGIELELEFYNPNYKTTIFVTNLSRECTKEDLEQCFSKAGEISSVYIKKGTATIRFKDSEGYCKSFLYNETIIKGKMVFLEPYSLRKQNTTKFKGPKGFKRPAFRRNGHDGVFKAKKPKFE